MPLQLSVKSQPMASYSCRSRRWRTRIADRYRCQLFGTAINSPATHGCSTTEWAAMSRFHGMWFSVLGLLPIIQYENCFRFEYSTLSRWLASSIRLSYWKITITESDLISNGFRISANSWNATFKPPLRPKLKTRQECKLLKVIKRIRLLIVSQRLLILDFQMAPGKK